MFEFGIGEAVPLSKQDGFEHGQQGIDGTAAVVSKVTGSLTIQVLFDRLPINHLIQLQQWEAVDVFGDHGLCGLPEEGAHEKSPKCLGGNLGDFGGILQRSHKGFVEKKAEEYKQKGRLKFSDGLFVFEYCK